MVRMPAKTCPNLSRLIEDGGSELLSGFLNFRAFSKLDWISKYRPGSKSSEEPAEPSEMLRQEKKDRLGPLETEAARVIKIAGPRGQYALEGVAREKLEPERFKTFMEQGDELRRSLWAYINEPMLFEAAENTLHLRLYRRYDKHYQTFSADPSSGDEMEDGRALLDALLADLKESLDRGDGYDVDRFDVPAEGDEPAAEMYLLFHPDPPTSVRQIDDDGVRSRFYFRPPGEAMIVYTPSTGRVHVRAGTRRLRHKIAESFIEIVLDQPFSSQPVDFQAYDIAQFMTGFELPTPDLDDVVILSAKVIRADISIGSLATRLSLSTTIDEDITTVIKSQPGLEKIFERAVAVRLIEIAVRYRRSCRDTEETLDFTITDRNTSSLLSIDDPFERVLGHQLLRHWGILREGREASEVESVAVLPGVLALWDTGAERVSGAWLHDRGIDPTLLIDLGFLVPAGWEGEDIIEDEDDLGQVDATVVASPQGHSLRSATGQEAPVGSPERHRVFRVRDGWVAQHLRRQASGVLDVGAVSEISPHLLALGALRIDDREVPVYLVRGIDDDKVRAAVDTELRARSDQGIGLVLQAGKVAGSSLAANVLSPIIDHLEVNETEMKLKADSLRAAFRGSRGLATGGQTVEFTLRGEDEGTLSVPGKGTIDIKGANRVQVIRKLVDAHNHGSGPVSTTDLRKGMEDQSLANIFGTDLWNKLKSGFVRQVGRGRWEIAT